MTKHRTARTAYTAREIFNPRIVPDSLIFINVAAARWPGPQGELNLRASGVLPAYQGQRRAAFFKSFRKGGEKNDSDTEKRSPRPQCVPPLAIAAYEICYGVTEHG